MHDSSSHSQRRGPALIAAGLVVLIFASGLSGAPVLTAFAFIALGATEVTLARHHNTARLLPLAILHAITYATLYALFLGATLQAATTSSSRNVHWLVVLDVAASLFPMAIAAQRISSRLLQSVSPRQ